MTATRDAAPALRSVFALDLGQAADYAAGVALRREARLFRIPAIFRWPLGTSYTVIVADVVAALQEHLGPLVVDAGGPGRPVLDMFRERGIEPVGVAITGGGRSNVLADGVLSVAKVTIVAALWRAVNDGTVKVAPGPWTGELVRELEAFGWRFKPGHRKPSWEGQSGAHDDIAVAAALGLWAFGALVGA